MNASTRTGRTERPGWWCRHAKFASQFPWLFANLGKNTERWCRRIGGGFVFGGVSLALLSAPAFAHEVRPAYLQLKEAGPGVFSVLWKQPILQDRRLAIDPLFPDECAAITPIIREVTGSALLHTWQVECPLRQGAIHISGLSRTITDVMVEISRLDGEQTTPLAAPQRPVVGLERPEPTRRRLSDAGG